MSTATLSVAIDEQTVPARLRAPMVALCRVGASLSDMIARNGLDGALGAAVGANTGGDTQKALDVIADEAMAAALKSASVRWYASEEREAVEMLDPDGDLAVAIDPLDGSSNIDTNVSIGTIFSIYPAADEADKSVLRPASEQIAAGYFIYGPQTALVVTFGEGVLRYVMARDTGHFHLVERGVEVPARSTEYAINASNYRHWPKPVRAFIDDCITGAEGPRAEDFNMRWIASLVAETHRILTRGGLFLYPSDDRSGYEQGRLRIVYECAPIAMLIDQAGGKATDGCEPILPQTAPVLHARTPLVFGSAEMVDKVAAYHDLPEQEVSALFGHRGLFRT